MRASERIEYLKKAPALAWDIMVRGKRKFDYDLMPVNITGMTAAKRMNLLMSGANLIHRRLHPWSWPLNMHIELTNYCSLRCSVCPTGIRKLERQPRAMDPALFERLMNEVGPYLLTASLWGWGEPLLHPQISDILRIVQNRGITTFLSTNGQSLGDDNVLNALIEYPPSFLIVCIDGITDETNSKFRIGAKIEPALRGVKRLAQMKAQRKLELPILHLRYIVMKHNEHELPLLYDFAKQNYFDMLTIRTLSIIDAPDDVYQNLKPDDERFRAYEYRGNHRVRRSDFICEKPFTFPAVFADGTVVACDQDCNAQHPYGTLADGSSFADIWWNKRPEAIRKTIRDNRVTFSFCKNCPFADRSVSTCSIEYYDLGRNPDSA